MSDVMGSDVIGSPSPPETHERANQFVARVEGAAALLKLAHAGEPIRIDPPHSKTRTVRRQWYSAAISEATTKLHRIIVVFTRHPASGQGVEAELEAFRALSDLTPAGPQLWKLAKVDRVLACKELAKHLEIVLIQYEKTADLMERLATDAGKDDNETPSSDPNSLDFARVRNALLGRAGGSLSLTQAAALLNVSRQALHKRILAGTALGMMVGTEIAVPRLQIVEANGRHAVQPGIGHLTKLFKQAEAGPWMALQFLVDPDPNLGRPPIEALRQGEKDAVVQAARAYLRLDEE
jgi:hypothetical protein